MQKRSFKYGKVYLIAISIVYFCIISIACGTFLFQVMKIDQGLIKTFMFLFIMLISVNISIFEFKYKNHFNISFYTTNKYPIAPLKYFLTFFTISLADIRMMLNFSTVIPLIIGMFLSGYSLLIACCVAIGIIIYFFLFEIIIFIIFFFREQLSEGINKLISVILQAVFFLLMILNVKNVAFKIPIISSPVRLFISLVEHNYQTSFNILGLLILSCLSFLYIGYWLTKKTV
jgi:hypothetical protein